MPEKLLPKPTDAELEILQILWEHGASPVRFVHETLNEQGRQVRRLQKSGERIVHSEVDEPREVGYTTTLKTMQIMHEKGLLARNTDARSHIYEAALPKEETQRNLLDTFVSNVFSGSAMNLVMQALGNHKASKSELDEIKALIERIEKNG
ncbi:MAG: BlaI/MecI/CopY family transcriptional regulator [Bacteroidota bacterium]